MTVGPRGEEARKFKSLGLCKAIEWLISGFGSGCKPKQRKADLRVILFSATVIVQDRSAMRKVVEATRAHVGYDIDS
ncbi:MAG: hypothetical protein QG577_2103 [Thermodesulfobacteriota bacterium]|nr:hypothetical protein [Thermodesulfobacteriota bacterium]